MQSSELSQPIIVTLVAALTRQFQKLSQARRTPGLTRLLTAARRFLPEYRGVVRISDGTRFFVDTQAQAVDYWILYTGDFEPAVTWVLRQHTPRGAYCLDIGANVGHYALRMATWTGAEGKVAAFEPDPLVATCITRSIEASRYAHVEVVPTAVSDCEESRTFYIAHKSIYSALDPAQVEHITRTVTVNTVTIDGFMRDHHWDQLDVIKIDTQGNDCTVLLGGRDTLTLFKPFILFEYQTDTPPNVAAQAFTLLRDLGYTLKTLSPYGKLTPFDPAAIDRTYVDVACFPPAYSS